ncbi:MAG: 2OG-Fe(II) oxygenase [Coleofasciculaceae cyanobacterium]
MKELFVNLVAERLRTERKKLQKQFHAQKDEITTRYFVADNLLPEEMCRAIYKAFPPVSEMRLISSFREKKYTSKALDRFPPILADATFAFQASEVIAEIEHICSFNDLRADPSLYAGGISVMKKDNFLNPHIDNSHDGERQFYRVLNLLYYVSPDWQVDLGGNLELWDSKVRKRLEVPSLFNRLVVMETNRSSYHSVNPVRTDRIRCCVSNYYFQNFSLELEDYFHITEFIARPEQPVVRSLSKWDNTVRTLVRHIFKQGLGKKDVYQGFSAEDK